MNGVRASTRAKGVSIALLFLINFIVIPLYSESKIRL